MLFFYLNSDANVQGISSDGSLLTMQSSTEFSSQVTDQVTVLSQTICIDTCDMPIATVVMGGKVTSILMYWFSFQQSISPPHIPETRSNT